MSSPPVVGEAERVSKSFGATLALWSVSLDVRAGECHGLVGRNGAGKSTLVSLLTGLERPDEGVVRLGGEPAPGFGDRAAWQRRVACVYQRSMVVPTLTVAENIFLNRPTPGGGGPFVSWGRVRSEARRALREWGFELDVGREAGGLTVEQRQIIEIARSLSIGARLLILDEPTAALEKAAIERLFDRVRRLRDGGVGILYISHHLEEIYRICDRVSVLRDGELVLADRVSEVSQARLVAAMVGAAPPRRVTEIETTVGPGPRGGGPRLEVSHLTVASTGGSVDDVSLTVAAGECVGLVGLNGSGSATLADAVVGLARPESGTISVEGRPLPPGKVDASVRRGVAYVPQDRHARGFAPQLGVRENETLPVLDRLSRWGVVQRAAQAALARREADRLHLVASSLEQPVSSLSGGNQQKVVVGRALAVEPGVLVVVNPTVGVDVASKEALLDTIARARDQGMAVLLVSDDFEDLRVCDRLLVMVRGRVVRTFERPPWDREELIATVEGVDTATLQGQGGTSTDG
jgi:simple sugar transport system ATP-binding protein